jgi:nitroreductase
MDIETSLDEATFFAMLRRLLPGGGGPLFGLLPWLPQVSLVIHVHRVRALAPGMYVLPRHPEHADSLHESFDPDFAWSVPPGCPEDLPLRLLAAGDMRERARQVCCGQAIASDGVFSLGMLARFDAALHEFGPCMYPRLLWETGMIGQMLYLEAEAAGIRGTGIGCFFDDEMHRLLGLADRSWQSLYHFTVGGAVEDERLQTAPAYPG